jgi:hypothetical protein
MSVSVPLSFDQPQTWSRLPQLHATARRKMYAWARIERIPKGHVLQHVFSEY